MKIKIKTVLDSIGNSIVNGESQLREEFFLSGGKAGISLFLYYYGSYLKNDKFIEYSYIYFEESFLAINSYNEKIRGKTLHGGYTGIIWLYQHYINKGFIEYSDEAKNVFDVFDELIKQEFFVEKETKNYDLFYGLLGYGVYFLERNKFISQKDILNDMVNILEEIAIKKEYGITWEDRFERVENKDKELINLGFAHGIPSIIVFLSYVYKETGYEKAASLIEKSITFLQHHELDNSKGSCFSFNILDEQPDIYPSRLAWCYGDLGIGYAILKAGILISNINHIEYGKRILTNLVSKTVKDETTGIKDAGFCHGATGVSHLFYKAFQYTNNIELYNASEYWIEIALKMENKNGGYSRYHYNDDEGRCAFVPDNGLLEGSAGVGLCLLSHIELGELDWDLCFLL